MNSILPAFFIFVALFASSAVGRSVDLTCPSYWSDLAVDVSIRVPLTSPPPGGKDFFALSPPVLHRYQELYKYQKAEEYDVVDGSLYAIFCGVDPERLGDTLLVKIGPNDISIPVTPLATGKDKSQGRVRIDAHSIEIVRPNWISPTKVTFEAPERNAYADLTMEFLAPSSTQLDIRSLKVRLLSEESRCRGMRYIEDAKRPKLKAHVMAKVGTGPDTGAYDGIFYPTVHCGPPEALEIDFGPLKYPKETKILIRLSRVVLVDPLEPTQMQLSCLRGSHLWDYLIRDDSMCRFFKEAAANAEVTLPSAAVEIDVRGSNVYPSSFTVQREDR